jgi:hypothetical protein
MSRARLAILASLLVAVGVLAIAWSRGADAEPNVSHRIVYLYVSGRGASAGLVRQGPPSGVQVQQALDTFAGQGFKLVSMASSGVPSVVTVGGVAPSGTDGAGEASYVILLER